jgi:hypothetical protein
MPTRPTDREASSPPSRRPDPSESPLGFRRAYAATMIPTPSLWQRLSPATRRRLVYSLWLVTWPPLFVGAFDPRGYEVALWFTVLHTVAFLALLRFRPMAFPAQLRIAYVAWLALGTFVPGLELMMYITIVGLAANLLWGYCPLSRMLYLLPWNREQPLTLRLVLLAFLTPPKPGRFAVPPPARPAATAEGAPVSA